MRHEAGEALPQPPAEWTGRSRGWAFGNTIMTFILRYGGLRVCYFLLLFIVPFFVLTAPRDMAAIAEYRRRAGRREWGPLGRLWGSLRQCYVFGQLLIDRVCLIMLGHEKFQFTFDGEEEFERTLKAGKGAIIITGHIGSFEAAAHMIRKLSVPVHVVALEAEERAMREFYARVFRKRHFSVIPITGTGEEGLAIANVLQRGEVVAILADRHLKHQASGCVRIPFLGEEALFPLGPYIIAGISGAPIITGFVMREGHRRYSFRADPARYLEFTDRASRRERAKAEATIFVKRLEEYSRRYPLQWRNFYRFWED